MQSCIDVLRTTVDEAVPDLLAIEREATARRPAPGKWSPREIIGHLIDSACNNHRRFVGARFQDHLVFDGYDQDAWVASQGYQAVEWAELVALWAAYNRHLARVMSLVPEDVRRRRQRRHNLHLIAFKAVPETEPASLEEFMDDYVAHLQHHLRQILGRDWHAAP